MNQNPLLDLENFGQSFWLDYISRNVLENGKIRGLLDNDSVRSLISTPFIFEKAIAESNDYDTLEGLNEAGLDLDALTQQLEDDGVVKFSEAFEKLMAALREERAAASQELIKL